MYEIRLWIVRVFVVCAGFFLFFTQTLSAGHKRCRRLLSWVIRWHRLAFGWKLANLFFLSRRGNSGEGDVIVGI